MFFVRFLLRVRFFLKFSNILEGCSTIFLLVLIKIGFSNISFYCSNMYTQCSNIPSRSSNIHSVTSNIRRQCSNKTINPIHPSLNLHPPSPLLPILPINTNCSNNRSISSNINYKFSNKITLPLHPTRHSSNKNQKTA